MQKYCQLLIKDLKAPDLYTVSRVPHNERARRIFSAFGVFVVAIEHMIVDIQKQEMKREDEAKERRRAETERLRTATNIKATDFSIEAAKKRIEDIIQDLPDNEKDKIRDKVTYSIYSEESNIVNCEKVAQGERQSNNTIAIFIILAIIGGLFTAVTGINFAGRVNYHISHR